MAALIACWLLIAEVWFLAKRVDGARRPFVKATTSRTTGEHTLKVMSLNVWGLPFGISKDRQERIRAIRDHFITGDYDIILLQELWLKRDYDVIKASMPYATRFKDLNRCLGITGFLCSGLAILSKYPIKDVAYYPFSKSGNLFPFDGELLMKKGLAIARIQVGSILVDIANAHLISGPFSTGYNQVVEPEDNNLEIRKSQARESLGILEASDAAVLIFGGDINAHPRQDPSRPYALFTSLLKDALVEKKGSSASLVDEFSTYANPRNTYTSMHVPERLDYIMYSSSPGVDVTVSDFSMPDLSAWTQDGIKSLSDHEPVVVTFSLRI